MNSYLSIQDAVEKTGKSQSTITRLVKRYTGTKHVKKDGKKYLISVEVLPEITTNYSNDYSETIQMNSLIEAKNETISLLKNQLDKKDKIIGDLIERNREANIIIKSLQEQISIPEQTETYNQYQGYEPAKQNKTSKTSNTPIIMDLRSKGMTYNEIAEQLNKMGKTNQYGQPYNANAIKTTVNRNK